ncbi:hypothetical protein PENTCL1PPCAC_16368 [Pristionchus entomophagus]|uniref:G protein-coupled receptor n=1 Tax=Pristionchus entomophagus TaxID=358040 RepID=A0AAV5TIV5_9BILA|nr:hypothetical protein PENTCL1PPCAC_16368 [Pristionchus entomophagus]
MKGVGASLGMNAHISLVINLTLLSMIAAWFNCCLLHRHQVILPFDHPIKLLPHRMYFVYLIMNVVMIINPISFIFTTNNDQEKQRAAISNERTEGWARLNCRIQSQLSWLLDTPSYKIYTDENSPLLMTYHFPFTLVTCGLCTLTTTILTRHAAKIMNDRRNQISVATIALQQRLICNLQIQMNGATIGMGGPIIFWTASLLIGFVVPGITSIMMLLLPISSLFNSVYAIVSTKSSIHFILDIFCFWKRRKRVKSGVTVTVFHVSPHSKRLIHNIPKL